jgi:hypothetical protein
VSLKRRLEKAAKRERLSVNADVVRCLEQCLPMTGSVLGPRSLPDPLNHR